MGREADEERLVDDPALGNTSGDVVAGAKLSLETKGPTLHLAATVSIKLWKGTSVDTPKNSLASVLVQVVKHKHDSYQPKLEFTSPTAS